MFIRQTTIYRTQVMKIYGQDTPPISIQFAMDFKWQFPELPLGIYSGREHGVGSTRPEDLHSFTSRQE